MADFNERDGIEQKVGSPRQKGEIAAIPARFRTAEIEDDWDYEIEDEIEESLQRELSQVLGSGSKKASKKRVKAWKTEKQTDGSLDTYEDGSGGGWIDEPEDFERGRPKGRGLAALLKEARIREKEEKQKQEEKQEEKAELNKPLEAKQLTEEPIEELVKQLKGHPVIEPEAQPKMEEAGIDAESSAEREESEKDFLGEPEYREKTEKNEGKESCVKQQGKEEEMPDTKEPSDSSEAAKKPFNLKKAGTIAASILGAVLLVGGGAYFAIGQTYKNAFLPGTQINGLDASGKTIDEVKQMIAAGIDSYTLTVEEQDGSKEIIAKAEIGLRPEFDGSLETLLSSQDHNKWLNHKLHPTSHEIETMIVYDETALEKRVKTLNCMNRVMEQPQNAHISDYISGQGYQIIPETTGSVIIPEAVEKGIGEAVTELRESISLKEAGAYKKADICSDHPSLTTLLDTMNKYANMSITYQFGDQTEVLGGERIHEWVTVNEDLTINIDPEEVAKYVEELAQTYNTAHKAKTLKTSYGTTIQVTGGNYGWKINQKEETAELINLIQAGESLEREPVYSQTAASWGINDYGDTYVEINLTGQHLFFYKDGQKIVESDFVSGNLSRGWGTPAGAFPLSYKQRNAILKGENYRTPVKYWMPFNGGIGMHDANWRGSFGGNIYKTNGSHGCINLPPSVAKTVYENISAGMPVICYNLSGSGQAGTTVSKPASKPAPAPAPPVEAPVVPEPVPPVAPEQPEQPAEIAPPPETTAPAGPGSDTNIEQAPLGPGSV